MNEKSRIYLDHNAATKVDPRVAAAVADHLRNCWGNPSSIHSFGRECRRELILARDGIAAFLGVLPEEVLFTSGATEGANLILRGWLKAQGPGHIITTGLEHSCVYQTIIELKRAGCSVTYLETGDFGAATPEAVEKEIRGDTKLIAIMAANNETGVKTDIEGIARVAKRANVPFFADGAALLGKELFHVPDGISAMCFSGQKIHAMQGIGFCFIRKGFKLAPLLTGGGQELGKRAGTENLPGIVSLSKAISLLKDELPAASARMRALRDRFETSLINQLEGVFINGSGPRTVNTSNISFTGLDGETLLAALDLEGLAASHGSACESGALEPSRALANMGLSRERVNSAIRFSIGRETTAEEIDRATQLIVATVSRLRKRFPIN